MNDHPGPRPNPAAGGKFLRRFEAFSRGVVLLCGVLFLAEVAAVVALIAEDQWHARKRADRPPFPAPPSPPGEYPAGR